MTDVFVQSSDAPEPKNNSSTYIRAAPLIPASFGSVEKLDVINEQEQITLVPDSDNSDEQSTQKDSIDGFEEEECDYDVPSKLLAVEPESDYDVPSNLIVQVNTEKTENPDTSKQQDLG